GGDPAQMPELMANPFDPAFDLIRDAQTNARQNEDHTRPRWPMIVLRSPKGWTGPDGGDGKQVEGTWRAHQVPLDGVRTNAEHRAELERWMRSYLPEELFPEEGAPG